jgi:Gas vesicle synthesis protein GvpL/GvpF
MADGLSTAGGRGVWVYAVAATIRREWFGRADGIGGRPVLGIAGSGGRDLTTRAHRHVVSIVAAHLPVVPMPAGTVYPDEAAVIRMLAVRRAEFTAGLLNVAAAAVMRPAARPLAEGEADPWSPTGWGRQAGALLPASSSARPVAG